MVMLLFAGAIGPAVSLSQCLRELHTAARDRRAKEIEERKAKGIPLDDDIRWSELSVDAFADALAKQDSAALREAAQKALNATSGLLLPVGDLEMPDGAEDIGLSFRVLSEAQRRELGGVESAAWSEVKAARDGGSPVALTNAIAKVVDARAAFVEKAVAGISGIDGKTEIDAELLDALRRTGLLTPIYEAALHFQDLPAKKALRFGQPLGSTSQNSIAANAQDIAGFSSGVMAGPNGKTAEGLTSTEPSIRPTFAPVDIS